jgi:hypothetical protein
LLQGTNYRQPDMSRPFIFHTDAAMKAVGAALTEIDDEYSVEYRSKTFKKHELNIVFKIYIIQKDFTTLQPNSYSSTKFY